MTDMPSAQKLPPNPLLTAMRKDARLIFKAGLRAADPSKAVFRHCRRKGETLLIGKQVFDLAAIKKIYVVGAGKAAASMAQAVEELLGDRITDGLISVKYGRGLALKHIRVIEAGHPLPDDESRHAARQILRIARRSESSDLVIVLLSGGGSALLSLPVSGIHIEDKLTVTQVMTACGATIHEINAVRKHLSAIKGGHLAQAATNAGAVITLILSDVVGDDMDVIASGPTVPDKSTYDDCLAIIRRHGIASRVPPAVQAFLAAGAAGLKPETPKHTTHSWKHVLNFLIGNNFECVQAASAEARARGYSPLILTTRLQGDAHTAARILCAIAREVLTSGNPVPPPACLLTGGETTVTVRGGGKGGRNQELALTAAFNIINTPNIVVFSGGTDGTDGPTDAAGAIADHTTVPRAEQAGLNLRVHLENNDAYPAFKKLGDLLISGPTRTNVMDLQIVLIRKPADRRKGR